ncbi:NACHT, LRR and PYD domains-containing protein 12-like [Astyanax mexicanus]|uniref:NACHT, LRR and PYD domains-containing protein 12-like n=1 Tax=Astyanax mexicanus TaxID=7994 RepID=UPI0020CB5D52|nr:NACHT, LRR and PYD domains-containing protein 12-like [Astyanax mexicanus]
MLLADSYLDEESYKIISSSLQLVNSSLKELDLSSNDLQDSGVVLLCAGLKSSHCKLQTLSTGIQQGKGTGGNIKGFSQDMRNVWLTCRQGQPITIAIAIANATNHIKVPDKVPATGTPLTAHYVIFKKKKCGILGSVLQSPNSFLKDLDLSNNDLQDSGVELLSAGLKSSHCKLARFRLSGCLVTQEGCSSLTSALKSNPSHLRELDLTYNHPKEDGVKLLSDLLNDPYCILDTLKVEHGEKLRMKPGLKKYARYLTLDPNTAHTHLVLSEENRKVERVEEDQLYPDHPDRFENSSQVLSVESLTGRCYWEAEWSGSGADFVVSYRGISRKEDIKCWFGNNKLSWRLYCCGADGISYSVKHNGLDQSVCVPNFESRRVGVYLDCPAGTLSFYSVSPDTRKLTHLHTFRTTFTEPLYAGFSIYQESSLCLCEIE